MLAPAANRHDGAGTWLSEAGRRRIAADLEHRDGACQSLLDQRPGDHVLRSFGRHAGILEPIASGSDRQNEYKRKACSQARSDLALVQHEALRNKDNGT